MDSLGSEVGHKMRAAIKAKLNELGCYVDDELPDYVMVMVANKRSRTQMEDDLQLFLGSRTEMFVFWLHQVLQKLQEVKIPPLGSSKEVLKRQSSNDSEITVKKEKKEKRHKKSKKDEHAKHKKSSEKRHVPEIGHTMEANNLKITDLLANQLLETVKKTSQTEENIKSEHLSLKTDNVLNNREKIIQKVLPMDKEITDQFDIPTISEIEKESSKLNIELSNTELDRKIETVRKELEIMQSDSDEDVININNDGEELLDIDEQKSSNSPKSSEDKSEPVIESTTPPRKPMSERLGQKFIKVAPTVQNRLINILNSNASESVKSTNIRKPLNRHTESRDSKNDSKNSIHSRLGNRMNSDINRISSKVITVPQVQDDYEDNLPVSVPSIIKVKPRPQIPANLQANRNLLLKAMAEAQKSIAQVAPRPQVVQRKPLELYTKKYRADGRKQISYGVPIRRNDMRITVNSDEIADGDGSMEYTPEPIVNEGLDISTDFQEYIPSLIKKSNDLEKNIEMTEASDIEQTPAKPIINPQFVVTLDGLDTSQFPSRKRKLEALKSPKNTNTDVSPEKSPKKIEKRKHTPIVYENPDTKDEEKKNSDGDKNKTDDSDKELMDRVNDTVKVIINDTASEEPKRNSVAEKTVKLKETQMLSDVTKKERCKFFPSCRLGDACEFLHPTSTVPCKAFPACKFGSACLYLHPKCKFGSDCIRKRDCPYSHNGVGPSVAAPVPAPTLSSTVSVVPNSLTPSSFKSTAVSGAMCRFYPQCSNPQCLFYHPKMCRFGKYCHNKGECNFYHHEMPSKEKFTWKPSAFTAI